MMKFSQGIDDMTQVIDGKAIAAALCAELAEEVQRLQSSHQVTPGLAVVRVGEDPASKVYVGMKVKKCAELGIYSRMELLPEDASQDQLLALVDELNNDPKIHGILVQLPLPGQLNEDEVIAAIAPSKDVDCFHPVNVGKMLIGDEDGFFPCTPHGVQILLEKSGIETSGKHCVVIGRSNIVGKPMAALMVQKSSMANCTVTICHSRTPDIGAITRQADILVAAIGKPEFVTADMVKEGAVVVDVGINRVDTPDGPKPYKLVGDVDFGQVAPVSSAITPVPGGVGPMTIATLMNNAVKACKQINKID